MGTFATNDIINDLLRLDLLARSTAALEQEIARAAASGAEPARRRSLAIRGELARRGSTNGVSRHIFTMAQERLLPYDTAKIRADFEIPISEYLAQITDPHLLLVQVIRLAAGDSEDTQLVRQFIRTDIALQVLAEKARQLRCPAGRRIATMALGAQMLLTRAAWDYDHAPALDIQPHELANLIEQHQRALRLWRQTGRTQSDLARYRAPLEFAPSARVTSTPRTSSRSPRWTTRSSNTRSLLTTRKP